MGDNDHFGKSFCRLISRRQHYDGHVLETSLKRCLGTAEITFFGISNMIGAGLFVLTGTLLKLAGPAGVLSYLMAGVSGVFAGLCYAEMATLVPKAGACYRFTYYAIGELYAYVIGWTMVSDSIVGYAAVAKAFSAALDVLVGNRISNGTVAVFGPIEASSVISTYPDIVAFGLIVVLMSIIASGAKDSLIVTATLASILLSLLGIIIVSTFVYGSRVEIWTSDKYGGFFPFGFHGTMEGASICVFAFGAFETITNTSEEAKKPHYSIPRAMVIVVSIVGVIYCSACAGLSLLVSKDSVNINAPFAYAFLDRGVVWLFYVSLVATMVATSDMSGMYVLPRILYAIASDGLLFPLFAHVTEKTKVPIWSLLIGGTTTALVALFIELSSLAEMTAVGLLLSYATVGIDVLIVRYNGMGFELRPTPENSNQSDQQITGTNSSYSEDSIGVDRTNECSSRSSINSCSSTRATECEPQPIIGPFPRHRSRFKWMLLVSSAFGVSEGFLCNLAIWTYAGGCLLISLLVLVGLRTEVVGGFWFVALFMLPLATAITVLSFLTLYTFKASHKPDVFETPLMPIVPCGSILLNTILVMTIQPITWLRFVVWTAIGLVVYFAYGIRHSTAGRSVTPPQQVATINIIDLSNHQSDRKL